MEEITVQLVSELSFEQRQRIANLLCSNSSWHLVGYYFEHKIAGVKYCLNQDYLRSEVKDGDFSMKHLCLILLDQLAIRGARIEDFLKALNEQGLFAIKGDIQRIISTPDTDTVQLEPPNEQLRSGPDNLVSLIKSYATINTGLQLLPLVTFIAAFAIVDDTRTAFGYQYWVLSFVIILSIFQQCVRGEAWSKVSILILKILLGALCLFFRFGWLSGEEMPFVYEEKTFFFNNDYLSVSTEQEVQVVSRMEISKTLKNIIFSILLFLAASRIKNKEDRMFLKFCSVNVPTMGVTSVEQIAETLNHALAGMKKSQMNIGFAASTVAGFILLLFVLNSAKENLTGKEKLCFVVIEVYFWSLSTNWFFLDSHLFSTYVRSIIPPTLDLACIYCFYMLSTDKHFTTIPKFEDDNVPPRYGNLLGSDSDSDDGVTPNAMEMQSVANTINSNNPEESLVVEETVEEF